MVTIIIPTLNRPDFIKRLLSYYASVNCAYPILIGDSSKEDIAIIIRQQIESLSKTLSVEYHWFPHLNDSQTIKALINLVKTPYAVFVADDDFLIPAGLKQCIDFLEHNPSYGAAHGRGILFTLKQSGVNGIIDAVSAYEQPVLEDDTAKERLVDILCNYKVSLFSVHRLNIWKRMYESIECLTDKTFTELLPCCLSAVEGKVKQLDVLYLVRQGHEERYFLPQVHQWLARPQWQPSFQVYINDVAQALQRKDNLTKEAAQQVVKDHFTIYLNKVVSCDQMASKNALWKECIRPRIKQIPGMVLLARWFKSLVTPSSSFCLRSLLNKASLYHEDFMPVYKIVTGKGLS